MLIEFAAILADLELKRATAVPASERPQLDLEAVLAGVPQTPAAILVEEDGGERPLLAGDVARFVADAVSAVAVAHGESTADSASARATVRATTVSVLNRLSTDGANRLTLADLSTLTESALIDAGQFELAQALVLGRASLIVTSSRPQTPGSQLRLIRRSGDVVDWNAAKIEVAVAKAFLCHGADPAPAKQIATRVDERAAKLPDAYIAIETIQDLVQEELMLAGHMRVAERYIVYRAERALLRARSATPVRTAANRPVTMPVLEPDGTEIQWDGEDLRARIAFATIGLEDLSIDREQLERELRRAVRPGVRRADLRKLILMNAKALIERDSELSRLAGRLLLTFIYEETLGWDIVRDGTAGLREAHRRGLFQLLDRGIAIKRISPALAEYDLDALAAAIDPTADLDFDFLGLQTLYDRYLIVDKTGAEPVRLEAPQLFWLRVAMGIGLGEPTTVTGERERRVLDLYRMYKSRRFCSSTPTLFNAGTLHSQLSSCYLYKIEDTLASIVGRGIAENAMLSKWAGGLGGSWTAVRGTGSHIESTNGESQGVVPFLKLHNDQLVAVNQGGKRAGSGCAYLEVWHNDIREFLQLRRNTGDERRRTHDMNTACWIPDLFMQRVEARGDWTLLRSSDVPDLHETYGAEFAKRYVAAEARAAAGEIYGETIPAIELWKQMLRMLFETGHPWLTFKDPCNVRSPQDHAGVIHSSNLCTEITLNTGIEETAVCNLGSVLIDQHLTALGDIDHAKLRETVRIAVRALDNVIDVNYYPTEPARTANARHRPVGLGVMGLQYALYQKKLAFDSPEAIAFGDEMMEAIAYYAYEASSDLAAERGTYQSYPGSKWDRGLLPQDTIDLLAIQRGEEIDVVRGGRLDWQPLREKIAAQGMRNSNVVAIAPTATISNITGTSPCIEPMYKNLFAKSNLSGDFTVLNPFMVRELKDRGIWNRELSDELKAREGDLTDIQVIPAELKERFRTAFQIAPRALVEAAARRQKWIDQSQSLNLFLASPDLKNMSHMYRHAWRAGLKTTYYLRTLGASSIEKSTVAAVAVGVEPESRPVGAFPAVPVLLAATSTPSDDGDLTVASSPAATLTHDDDPGAERFGETAVACSVEAMRSGGECEACQ